jgi:catalase (peroxidase I)
LTHSLSYSDLIQLGGAAAVEYCGGPFINVGIGRTDFKGDQEENFPKEPKLPSHDMSIQLILLRSKRN